MSLVVNTNIASMNAQRSLHASGRELSTAMERLSTGKKINSAADDAAGFAIAESMTAQIGVYQWQRKMPAMAKAY